MTAGKLKSAEVVKLTGTRMEEDGVTETRPQELYQHPRGPCMLPTEPVCIDFCSVSSQPFSTLKLLAIYKSQTVKN